MFPLLPRRVGLKMLDDEVSPFGRVLSHEEIELAHHVAEVVDRHGNEAHLVTDELLELARTDLPKPLKTGHLGAADRSDRLISLVFRVAVPGFALVANPEQRGFEDVEMLCVVAKLLLHLMEEQMSKKAPISACHHII